jgi:glycosyltransferase involved in cell wall biosynthesis
MRILWICGLPRQIQQGAVAGEFSAPLVDLSWIVAHFPPPPEIELHLSALWPGGNRRERIDWNGATFHLVPCPRHGRALLLFLRDRYHFAPVFAETLPSVVHGWGTEDSFGLVARQLAPARHVIGVQGLIGEYRSRIKMPLRCLITQFTEWQTLRRAKWVVAECSYAVRAARPLCPRANIREIEHPLRRDFIDANPSDGAGKTVLFLGEINERKGIDDAIESFAAATSREWTLHVIGRGSAQTEAAMYARIGRLDLQGRFRHTPSLSAPEIVSAMQESSIFLLPTRIDTGPTALKEALAMGLWPVCYDNSGPAEYLRSANFGSLARDGDQVDLTRKLSDAIRERPWINESRRSALRRFTHDRFSRTGIWSQLIQLYTEIESSTAGTDR